MFSECEVLLCVLHSQSVSRVSPRITAIISFYLLSFSIFIKFVVFFFSSSSWSPSPSLSFSTFSAVSRRYVVFNTFYSVFFVRRRPPPSVVVIHGGTNRSHQSVVSCKSNKSCLVLFIFISSVGLEVPVDGAPLFLSLEIRFEFRIQCAIVIYITWKSCCFLVLRAFLRRRCARARVRAVFSILISRHRNAKYPAESPARIFIQFFKYVSYNFLLLFRRLNNKRTYSNNT